MLSARLPGYLLVALSLMLGGGSLLLFVVFLYAGPLGVVRLGLGDPAALALNATLCLLFFVQHSLMTREWFRRRLTSFVRAEYHASVYSIASGIFLLCLLVLWQGTNLELLQARGLPRLILRVVFVLSLVGFAWGDRSLGQFDGFGAKSALRHLKGRDASTPRFSEGGAYRWIRHPLYLLTLLLIWSSPDVTADRLLFNGLFTIWIVVGTLLEERDLRSTFGEQYRDYQKRVPMLIPYRLPRSTKKGDIPNQG